MTTDTELCNALRGWITTNFPAQPLPSPPPPPSPPPLPPLPATITASFFNGHIQAPGRFGNTNKPPSSYGLQFDMVRLLAIWSVPGIAGNTYVSWGQIHTGPGQFNWAGYDAYVAAMKAWGINSMMVPLHSPPAWIGLNPTPAQTAEFITAICKRAPGFVKAVEGWNEFNAGSNIYSGTGVQLAAIQKAMWDAARAVDPNIKVLSPTLTNAQNNPPGYPANQGVLALKPFLDAGGVQWCDTIGVHVYLYGTTDYAGQMNRVVQNTHDLFKSYGKDLPVWMTEGGPEPQDGITDPAAQTAFMKTYLDGMIANKVARMFWYCWDNNNLNALWSSSTGNLTAFGTEMQTYRKGLGV